MRFLINKKVFLILIASQLLCSCAITRGMWGGSSTMKYDEVESFFIDKANNRIVLIGEAGYKTKIGTHHYSIQDQSGGRLIKIFEIAQKSGYTHFSFSNMQTTGSEVKGSFGIGFKRQNLSPEDIKISEDEGLGKVSDKAFLGRQYRFDNNNETPNNYKWPLTQTTRYPSSKEPVKNFCSDSNQSPNCIKIVKFNEPWKGPIRDNYTTGDKAIRIAATPFAVIADILLTPIYIIGVIGMGVGGN